MHAGWGRPRRAAAGDRVGRRARRPRPRRRRAVRDLVPLATPAHARDRAPQRRRLCPRGRARARRSRSAWDDVGAPDRIVHAGAHRRQRASGGARARRHRVLRDRVRAGSGTARRRSRAREHGVDRFGAARPDGLAALSSVAPRRAGARQAMTETKGPDRIVLPAPTAWPMAVALGVTLGFGGLVTHRAVTVVGVGLALFGRAAWWRCVLPEEREEHVPVPAMPIVAPARVTVRSAERFALGAVRPRLRGPVEAAPLSAGPQAG